MEHYPVIMKNIANGDQYKYWVLFLSENTGIVVKSNYPEAYPIGTHSTNWYNPFIETKIWKLADETVSIDNWMFFK